MAPASGWRRLLTTLKSQDAQDVPQRTYRDEGGREGGRGGRGGGRACGREVGGSWPGQHRQVGARAGLHSGCVLPLKHPLNSCSEGDAMHATRAEK